MVNLSWKKNQMNKKVKKDEIFTLYDMANTILQEISETKFTTRKCLHCSTQTFHLLKIDCCKKFLCYSCIFTMDNKHRKCGICHSKCNNV